VTQELLSMIDNGKDLDDTLTIHFPAPATIRTMEIFETAWKAPPDKFMEEPDYLLAHGDPDTNGKQDRRQKQEGRTMVKLWEPKIWKLTKQRITQQQRYREENPGDSELEQKMAQDRFSAFGESLGVGDRQKAYGDTDDGDAKKKAAKAGEDDVDVEVTDKYEFSKRHRHLQIRSRRHRRHRLGRRRRQLLRQQQQQENSWQKERRHRSWQNANPVQRKQLVVEEAALRSRARSWSWLVFDNCVTRMARRSICLEASGRMSTGIGHRI
jgi:hypothetical protein